MTGQWDYKVAEQRARRALADAEAQPTTDNSPPGHEPPGLGAEISATEAQWEEKARGLWSLLDDIDTYGDMFKPPIDHYFKAVQRKCEKRFDYLDSDGHRLLNLQNDVQRRGRER